MNALSTKIDEQFGRCRPLVINGDAMAPTLRPHRDVAMVMPVSRYAGEGIYVLTNSFGFELYRVQAGVKRGSLHLFRDNKAYGESFLTVAEFEESVAGKVIGRVEFFDQSAYGAFLDFVRLAA